MTHVLRVADVGVDAVETVTTAYRVALEVVHDTDDIPGSYWGAPEAGLVAGRLYARADTPLHSVLHELSHYVCMSPARRLALHTDAGGTDDEECAVCYLQIVLANALSGFGRERCFDDMDAWGYSFREGSARAWFAGDGRDARLWLRTHDLIDERDTSTWRLR